MRCARVMVSLRALSQPESIFCISPRLNKCFFSPGLCLCKHKLIYPSKEFNDLHVALELPSQFL